MPEDSAPARPADLEALLGQLASRPSPAVLWYGSDGGRVELSGRVGENWIAKTANLLVDDLGLVPGDRVLLDPMPHWRTLVVVIAAWRLGATVVLPSADTDRAVDGGAVQVAVVQDRTGAEPAPTVPASTEAAGSFEDRLVLAYPGLAMRLPEGVAEDGDLDYCAEIRAHGDHWSGASRPAAQDPALVASPGTPVSFERLLEQATERAAALRPGTSVHLGAIRWDAVSLTAVLAVWLAQGAVVLSDLAAGPSLDRALTEERVELSWS